MMNVIEVNGTSGCCRVCGRRCNKNRTYKFYKVLLNETQNLVYNSGVKRHFFLCEEHLRTLGQLINVVLTNPNV